MAPKSRGASLLLDTFFQPSAKKHICLSCRNNLNVWRARYASTATAQASIEAPPISQLTADEPGVSSAPQPRVVVKAGVVVSRPPLTTPDPHPFDTAFYLYQRRLNERLVLPFSQYFHYKRGTPAFEHWRTKRRERGGIAARDLGKYNAYTKESWNDETLMGDDTAAPQKIVEQLIEEEGRGAEFAAGEGEGEREGNGSDARLAGLKRSTEADQSNDQKSLERSLSRTLYLLVRDKDAHKSWRFPAGDVEVKEGLKEAAQRALGSSCGINMNTWFVANHPIGHSVEQRPEQKADAESAESEQQTETGDFDVTKTFFMKARIFAGQADIRNNSYELEDFKWLSKEEIEKHVTPEYWQSVKNMLVEQ